MSTGVAKLRYYQLIRGIIVGAGEEDPGDYHLPPEDEYGYDSVTEARYAARAEIERAERSMAAVCARITYFSDQHDTEDYYTKGWPL